MLERARRHWGKRVVFRKAFEDFGIDGSAVYADAQRAVVLAGHVHQKAHLVLPRLGTLVVIKMPRVVADLVHVRRRQGCQAVALLQVHGQVRPGARANLRKRLNVTLVVHGNAHHVAARRREIADLGDRGFHVPGVGRTHALHGDRVSGTYGKRADPHRPGWISCDIH